MSNLGISNQPIICDNAEVGDDTCIQPGAWLGDQARICDSAYIGRGAIIRGNAEIRDHASITGVTKIYGNAQVYGNASVDAGAQVSGTARICDNVIIVGRAKISGLAVLESNQRVLGDADIQCRADSEILCDFIKHRTLSAIHMQDGSWRYTEGWSVDTYDDAICYWTSNSIHHCWPSSERSRITKQIYLWAIRDHRKRTTNKNYVKQASWITQVTRKLVKHVIRLLNTRTT